MAIPKQKHEMGMTSLSLLEAAKANDSDAWSRLLSLYGPLVYSWCRTQGLQESDASDVMQAVFRNTCTALVRFTYERPGSTFRGWLRVITSNQIRDWHRSNQKNPRGVGGSTNQRQVHAVVNDEIDDDKLIPDSIENEQLHEALLTIRADTEDRTWQAFWMTTIDGRLASDVAEELGMQRQAVFQAKSRTLKRLRNLLLI